MNFDNEDDDDIEEAEEDEAEETESKDSEYHQTNRAPLNGISMNRRTDADGPQAKRKHQPGSQHREGMVRKSWQITLRRNYAKEMAKDTQEICRSGRQH